MRETVKVAVVGSGLAGLTAAYLLSRDRNEEDVAFEVHLFEKSPSIGMDSSSISLPIPDTDDVRRIDVPMRSFQGGYYPQIIKLYKHLGVSSRVADFSYSFSYLTPSVHLSDKSQTIITKTIYDGASGRRGVSMPSWIRAMYVGKQDDDWASRIAVKTWCWGLHAVMVLQLVYCFLRFSWMSVPIFRPSRLRTMTFREWSVESVPKGLIARLLGLDTIWGGFISGILIPIFSAVCTTGEEDVLAHPMEEFLDYMWLTLGTHHYVVEHGVRDVVRRLSKNIEHIHLGTPISSIEPDSLHPRLATVTCLTADGRKTYEGFSHIVFATQAPKAVSLLKTYAAALPQDSKQFAIVMEQIECIKKFEYRTSIVINHTDDTLLPDSIDDHRDLNLILLAPGSSLPKAEKQSGSDSSSDCVDPTHTMTTHILMKSTKYPRAVYQTTNPIVPPRADSILSVSKLERALLTMESKKALGDLYLEGGWITEARLGRLQGFGWRRSNEGERDMEPGVPLWFCGAYAAKGIPLLEGCVVSARLVAEQIQRNEGVEVLES